MGIVNMFEDPDAAITRMAIPVTTTTTKFHYTSDLVVLLDIDHTMIFSKLFDSKAAAQAYVKEMPTTTSSDSEGSSTVRYFELESDNSARVFHVNCRPFLKEFLETVCPMFETHIFTAGTLSYAKFIVSILDPQGLFLSLDRIWSRANCARGWVPTTASQQQKTGYELQYWKDLSSLPFNLSRVILIDDNRLNFKANPCNTIMVKAFYDDPNDKELVSVFELLRDTLKECEDVRPILKLKNAHHFSLLSKPSP